MTLLPKLAFTFTFFLLYNLTDAQEFKVHMGEETDKTLLSGGYTIKIGNTRFNLRRYSKNLDAYVDLILMQTDVLSNKIISESKEKFRIDNYFGIRFEELGGRLYIIYQELLKGGNIGNIMAAEVDTTAMRIMPARIIVDVQKESYNANASFKERDHYKFYFKTSNDRTKAMILLSYEKTSSKYFVAMLDNMLNVTWQRITSFNYPDGVVSIRDVCLDNEGKIYVAYRIAEVNKKNTTNINHVSIVSKEQQLKDISIDAEGSQLFDISLLPSDTTNAIHFAGYYFESDFQSLQGVYSGKINSNTFEISNFRKDAFPSEIITQLTKDGWAYTKGKLPGIKWELQPTLIELQNGELDVLGQCRSLDQGTHMTSFISGAIVNAIMTNQGTVFSWILLNQTTSYFSDRNVYSAFPFKEKLLVFFNNDKEYMENEMTEPVGDAHVYQNLVLAAAIFNPDGTASRHLVIDEHKENFVPFPGWVERVDVNRFIIPFHKEKGSSDRYKIADVIIE